MACGNFPLHISCLLHGLLFCVQSQHGKIRGQIKLVIMHICRYDCHYLLWLSCFLLSSEIFFPLACEGLHHQRWNYQAWPSTSGHWRVKTITQRSESLNRWCRVPKTMDRCHNCSRASTCFYVCDYILRLMKQWHTHKKKGDFFFLSVS